MTNISKGFLLLTTVCALGLSSCSDDSPWAGSTSEGGINLDFSSDSRVMRQTRADDSVSPIAPEGELFSVNLKKSDGSYNKEWNGVESFNSEKSFPIGDYTLTTWFGDIEEEGFNSPYFKGETNIHVSPGAVTDAHVVATLANAMVSLRYTDDFINFFKEFSAEVKTDGHTGVYFAQTEERPAYIAPSAVKLNLTLVNHEDRVVTIQPAGFTAQPRHHYVITLGLDGTGGNVALDVQFDDNVIAETVNVVLGDELFSAPAPTLTAKGFDPNTTIDTYEYVANGLNPQFHVVSFGGLKSTTLDVVAPNSYSPSFGRSVELVNANKTIQEKLIAEGVEASGFFRNVDKMGVVGVGRFIENLPVGNYTIQVQAVDAMTRTTEPLSLAVNVKPVELSFGDVHTMEFNDTEMIVDIKTNCEAVKNLLTFKVQNEAGNMVDVKIKNVQQVEGGETYTFRYTLEAWNIATNSVTVQAILGKRIVNGTVPVKNPVYSVEVDAFARRATLVIKAENEEERNIICNNLKIFNGNSQIATSNISIGENGYVYLNNLNSATKYDKLRCVVGAASTAVPEFTTEAESAIVNGNFSELTMTINTESIDTGNNGFIRDGAQWSVPPADYWNWVKLKYSEPNGWASLNQLTCNLNATNLNTWFVIASTYAQDGAVVIRSVGYNHNGTLPNKTGGTFSTTYYNPNPPATDQFICKAGELFLGSYSFDGSEHRVDGMAFASRPDALTFKYQYEPMAGERAEVLISIISDSGEVLATQTVLLDAAETMTDKSIALVNYPFGKKAATIKLNFKSTATGTTPALYIPSGKELNEGWTWSNFVTSGRELPDNTYKAYAAGSKLTIDDVAVSYNTTNGSKAAKKFSNKR